MIFQTTTDNILFYSFFYRYVIDKQVQTSSSSWRGGWRRQKEGVLRKCSSIFCIYFTSDSAVETNRWHTYRDKHLDWLQVLIIIPLSLLINCYILLYPAHMFFSGIAPHLHPHSKYFFFFLFIFIFLFFIFIFYFYFI